MKENLLIPKVHFVAGKGGVGKTLISQALASFFAQKYRTLLVELSEEETKGSVYKSAVIQDNITQNLSHLKIFPDQALYEYLTIKIPAKKVLDTLLSEKLFRALCSAMPGLSDLTRLGKIWYHAEDRLSHHQQIFDKIVVDMPSSGYVHRFLSVAGVVKDAVKIGPLAKDAELIDNYFASNNARLHLVTCPEEIIVDETLELMAELSTKSKVNLGLIFINRVLPLDSDKINQQSKAVDLSQKNIAVILDVILKRLAYESEQLKRLNIAKKMSHSIYLKDCISEELDSEIVKQMIKTINEKFYHE